MKKNMVVICLVLILLSFTSFAAAQTDDPTIVSGTGLPLNCDSSEYSALFVGSWNNITNTANACPENSVWNEIPSFSYDESGKFCFHHKYSFGEYDFEGSLCFMKNVNGYPAFTIIYLDNSTRYSLYAKFTISSSGSIIAIEDPSGSVFIYEKQ